MCTTSSHSSRSTTFYRNNGLELVDSSRNEPVVFEIGSRCNKNGINILPDIPEESEEDYDSDDSNIHEDACAVNNDVNIRDITLYSGQRSMDNCSDIHKVNVKLSDDSIDNNRWSIGTVEEMMPVCVQKGLANYWSVSENINIGKADEGNKSFENSFQSVELEIDKHGLRTRSSALPVNSTVWIKKSLSEVGSDADVSEYDHLLSKSMDTVSSHSAKKRKVRSMEDIVSAFGKVNYVNQNDSLEEGILTSNMNSIFIHSSDKSSTSKYENEVSKHVNDIKLPCESKHVLKRWRTGNFEEILSANAKSSTENVEVTDNDGYQKWYSTEMGNSDQSMDQTGFSHKLIPNDSFTFEVREDHSNTGDISHNDNEARCLSPSSEESEYPLWAAETVVEGTSDNCRGSNSMTEWSKCPMSKVLQRLKKVGKVNFIHQNDALEEGVLTFNVNNIFIHSSEELSTHKYENEVTKHVNNIKLPYENKHVLKRWRTTNFEDMLSANAKSSTEDVEVTDSDSYQKWYSTDMENSDQSVDRTRFSLKLIPNNSYRLEFQKGHSNTDVAGTGDLCHKDIEAGCLAPCSEESEYPLWAAKLMSSETVVVASTSHSCRGSNSLRDWSKCPLFTSQVLRKVIFRCSCHIFHRQDVHQQYASKVFAPLLWWIWECVTIPHFFPSLLLRFASRLCPMMFAALSPSLAKQIIEGCTKEEAVFAVVISGFVWLCFLVLTPWCYKMSPNKQKYLFAAGNVVAASGIYCKYEFY